MTAAAQAKSRTSTGQLFTGQGFVTGLVAFETAASTAVVKLFDGTSNSGQLIDVITLAASTAQSHLYSGHVWFSAGLYLELTSGAATVVAHIG